MSNPPDATELLAIARATLLDKLLPQLPEASRYDALMIANAMAIAIREYAAGDAPAQAELARLRTLYTQREDTLAGEPLEDALTELNRRLATDIRGGRFDGKERAVLLDHLEKSAADELAIANPKALKS
jgi:hypothetical protein